MQGAQLCGAERPEAEEIPPSAPIWKYAQRAQPDPPLELEQARATPSTSALTPTAWLDVFQNLRGTSQAMCPFCGSP